ncbi:MAG: peroxiredoxin family protein [Acidimicrobiales bacterium]
MSNRTKTKPQKRVTRSTWAWLGLILPVVALAVLVALGAGSTGDSTPDIAANTQAPLFELPTNAGTTVSLQDELDKSDVLLYFSMGVGCDSCFAQIPEVETALAEMDLTLIPIMVQSADLVAATAGYMGVTRPILIDEDQSVSKAYDMIGINGHTDRPFHSIVLVKQDGTISYINNYNTMFVGLDAMMADIREARA